MTHTNATYTVTTKPATGNGDIDGFEVRCSACIEHASFSFRSMTEAHGRSHIEYMRAKEAKPARRKRAR